MNTPKLTHEQIRAAGGIVHSDGNIFFTNIEKLNNSIAATQAQAKPQPLSDEQALEIFNDLEKFMDQIEDEEIPDAILAGKSLRFILDRVAKAHGIKE